MVDIQALDPDIGIPWNTTGQLIRSDKDTHAPSLSEAAAAACCPPTNRPSPPTAPLSPAAVTRGPGHRVGKARFKDLLHVLADAHQRQYFYLARIRSWSEEPHRSGVRRPGPRRVPARGSPAEHPGARRPQPGAGGAPLRWRKDVFGLWRRGASVGAERGEVFAGELAVADQLVGQTGWGGYDLHEPLAFRVVGFLGDVAEDHRRHQVSGIALMPCLPSASIRFASG